MALRKIVEQGDECLTKVCRPVTKFDRRLHDLLDDMAETLADANGAGLAAPQVGILRRVCLVLDEEAEEYLELLQEMRLYPKYRESKEKEGEAIAEEIAEIDSWLLRGLADVGLAIAGGVTDAVTGLANFGKMVLGEEDMIISSLSHANGLNIERVKEKSWMCGALLEFTSGVTASGLGVGVSIVTGNPLAGAAVLGAQTSGNTYARELESGKEADDARAYSLLIGIGTGTLQYLLGGIRAFGHSGGYGAKAAGKANKALGGVVKQPVGRSALNGIAKQMKEMGKEAFEEYVETTLEPVYRNLIYDEENELELLSVKALENAFVGALTAGALNLILPESGVERNRTLEEDAKNRLSENTKVLLGVSDDGIINTKGLKDRYYSNDNTLGDVNGKDPNSVSRNFCSVKSLQDLLTKIPTDAQQFSWRAIEGGASEGVKYRWVDQQGNIWNVRAHSVDPSAPIGSNASKGWIYRVEVRWAGTGKKYYMDAYGNFYPENIMNPMSPMYDEDTANNTHIPFKSDE